MSGHLDAARLRAELREARRKRSEAELREAALRAQLDECEREADPVIAKLFGSTLTGPMEDLDGAEASYVKRIEVRALSALPRAVAVRLALRDGRLVELELSPQDAFALERRLSWRLTELLG